MYLHQFDTEMTSGGHKIVRFADDFVILVTTQKEAEDTLKFAKDALDRLKLEINEDKTRICSLTDGFIFLGYEFTKSGKRPAPEAVQRLVKKITQTGNESSREYLESIIRGWMNYFKIDVKTYEELTLEFQRILNNNPDSLPARLSLAALYLQKNESDKAKRVITATSTTF
ncbi:MAG: hypothetical protein KKE44_26345 [Proteobacteria bacterium]|nr:hypothetical protein [Bacteroidota bacterium]MBU1586252.1 hypothetical protein [Pseudomonadota bacterium]